MLAFLGGITNEYHLGRSQNESRGHGLGGDLTNSIWLNLVNSNAAVTGLLQDLEDTALLIDGVGSDMISDALCNILRRPLIKYTQDMCLYYGISMEPEVDSGPLWNPQKEMWEHAFVQLPVTEYGKVILVPKILVRRNLDYQCDKYYRHYVLPAMQAEHLKKGSSLIQVLKNGVQRVTKKSLMLEYGNGKLAAVEQTVLRPHILQKYKEDKLTNSSKPLTLTDFAEVENVALPDLTELICDLKNLQAGKANASEYEELIEKILSVVFYPSLCHPKKQHSIHNGRKRIDITYTNEAREGFFYWLSRHYAAGLIFVECKNYSGNVANPELDQLAGRVAPSRGRVGILVCRSFNDKDLFIQRCIATAKDDRGFIIPLDDDDISSLVQAYQNQDNPNENDLTILRRRFEMLIE